MSEIQNVHTSGKSRAGGMEGWSSDRPSNLTGCCLFSDGFDSLSSKKWFLSSFFHLTAFDSTGQAQRTASRVKPPKVEPKHVAGAWRTVGCLWHFLGLERYLLESFMKASITILVCSFLLVPLQEVTLLHSPAGKWSSCTWVTWDTCAPKLISL